MTWGGVYLADTFAEEALEGAKKHLWDGGMWSGVDLSSDGRRMLLCNGDVSVLDATKPELPELFRLATDGVDTAFFSSDGARIFTASSSTK